MPSSGDPRSCRRSGVGHRAADQAPFGNLRPIAQPDRLHRVEHDFITGLTALRRHRLLERHHECRAGRDGRTALMRWVVGDDSAGDPDSQHRRSLWAASSGCSPWMCLPGCLAASTLADAGLIDRYAHSTPDGRPGTYMDHTSSGQVQPGLSLATSGRLARGSPHGPYVRASPVSFGRWCQGAPEPGA
jgi:hypothetical protein